MLFVWHLCCQHGSALWQWRWQSEQEEEKTAPSFILLLFILVVVVRQQGHKQSESEVQSSESFSLQRQKVRRLTFQLFTKTSEQEWEIQSTRFTTEQMAPIIIINNISIGHYSKRQSSQWQPAFALYWLCFLGLENKGLLVSTTSSHVFFYCTAVSGVGCFYN